MTEAHELVAADGQSGDNFGYSVAISSAWVLIGADRDDDPYVHSGSAYVFPVGSTAGSKIDPGDLAASDGYGSSVAISGNTIVVGAPFHGVNGAAYIFDYGFWWDQQAKLLSSSAGSVDRFGRSVAISGDYVVVGEPYYGTYEGAVYFFERHDPVPDGWGEVARRVASDAEDHANFGHSVAISGEIAVVGAPFEDSGAENAGVAYVFERSVPATIGLWNQKSKLIAPDAAKDDFFGLAVAVSGNLVVVGAERDDDDGESSGSVYVFERRLSQFGYRYEFVTKLTAADAAASDYFGTAVSISGTTVVVGAKSEGSSNTGAAYVFDLNTARQVAKLRASDSGVSDRFGGAVGVYDSSLVVGAIYANASAGSAYVFKTPLFADDFESGNTSAWSATY